MEAQRYINTIWGQRLMIKDWWKQSPSPQLYSIQILQQRKIFIVITCIGNANQASSSMSQNKQEIANHKLITISESIESDESIKISHFWAPSDQEITLAGPTKIKGGRRCELARRGKEVVGLRWGRRRQGEGDHGGEDVGGSANDVRPLPKATPLRRLWRQGEKSSLFLGVASSERGRKSNTMVGWETVLPWKTTRLGWKLAVAESFQRCDEGPGDDGWERWRRGGEVDRRLVCNGSRRPRTWVWY